MNPDPMERALRYRWLIFCVLALGYIMVYFHRLCTAVVAVDMMHDLKAGGTIIGLLAAAYFYPYALMQLPAGLLSDSWGKAEHHHPLLLRGIARLDSARPCPRPLLGNSGKNARGPWRCHALRFHHEGAG